MKLLNRDVLRRVPLHRHCVVAVCGAVFRVASRWTEYFRKPVPNLCLVSEPLSKNTSYQGKREMYDSRKEGWGTASNTSGQNRRFET